MSGIPTNQIARVMTSRKLVALYDKLKMADVSRYAQIHAKGENSGNGRKLTSLIQVRIQDYSAGTGNNSINADFNLAPEQVQFIFSRIEAGWRDFDFHMEKIYGNADQSGYAIAQKFSITRHDKDMNGNDLRSPWQIRILNGKGIKLQNQNGGFYMKGGSFVQEKNVFIMLADIDAFTLFKRADSFIRAWEDAVAPSLIAQGRKALSDYIDRQHAAVQQPVNSVLTGLPPYPQGQGTAPYFQGAGQFAGSSDVPFGPNNYGVMAN